MTPASAFDGSYILPGVGFWRLLSLNSFSRDAIFRMRMRFGGNEALTYWQWIVCTSGISFHWHFSRKRSLKVCVHDLCTKCLRCRRASANLQQVRELDWRIQLWRCIWYRNWGNFKRNNMSDNRCSVYSSLHMTCTGLASDYPWLCCNYWHPK